MPIADIGTARDEILSHFTTVWNAQTPPVPDLHYDDKTLDLPTASPYARITIKHTPLSLRTVGGETGNRRFRRFGVVTVQVFTLFGDGLQEADRIATIAANAFEGQKTGEDRVTFRETRIEEVGEAGLWFQTNVVVDFDWDTVK